MRSEREQSLLASTCRSVRTHATIPVPPDGFSWNFMFRVLKKFVRLFRFKFKSDKNRMTFDIKINVLYIHVSGICKGDTALCDVSTGQRNKSRSKSTTTFYETHSLQQVQTSRLLRDKNNKKLSRSLSQKYKKYATKLHSTDPAKSYPVEDRVS